MVDGDADSEDAGQIDWNEVLGKLWAAGVGAGIGLPLGPPGAIVGAIAGVLLEPFAVQLMQRVGADGKRRAGEALAAACEACEADGLPADEALLRMSSDEKFRLLTGTALGAATHTVWEEKVRTLGRSLASGLLAADDAEISVEQLILSAIADIEGPHLALLDLLVASHPPIAMGDVSSIRLEIPEYSYSCRQAGVWDAGRRKWSLYAVQHFHPRIAPVFTGLVGTLQRHGLIAFTSNSNNIVAQLESDFKKDIQRLEQQQRTGRNQSKPPVRHTPRITETWEPTELGEQVWLRFRDAGADVPEVWASSPAES